MIHRRSLLAGLGAALFAPAIVRAGSLMPIRAPTLVITSPLDLAMAHLAEAREQFEHQMKLAILGDRYALEQITQDAQGLLGAAANVYGAATRA